MGHDTFNYDQAVTAEGLLDLYVHHSNVQQFQHCALRWARHHGAELPEHTHAESVASVAGDLSAGDPGLTELADDIPVDEGGQAEEDTAPVSA